MFAAEPTQAAAQLVGRSVRRREDLRLLTGVGRFVDDIQLPGMLHAAFVRSPHAHARIARLDAHLASRQPGARAVVTGADVRALGYMRGHLWTTIPASIQRWLEPQFRDDLQPLLPWDYVRYAGQPVALVAADSQALAQDAVEHIQVEYEPLAAVLDAERALAANAPRLNPEWPDNVALHVAGKVGEPAAALDSAAHTARVCVHLHRQTGTPIETRGLAVAYERSTAELTIWSNTQVPHALRGVVAEMLGLPEHRVRVIAVDSGGGFGIKGGVYVEEVLVPLLAVRVGRPVKWIEARSEHMTGSIHSRDQIHDIEVCADERGHLLGVRDRFLVDIGAFNPLRLTSAANTVAHLVGPYRVPAIDVDGQVVVTNKMISAPYRGAGRPEAVWAFERALDRLARTMGVDPVELRRRNTLGATEMPWNTGMYYRDGQQLVYDSGDYQACLEDALQAVGFDDFRARQADARARHRYVGVGVAAYVEGTGIGPYEGGRVCVDGSGQVVVYTGACAQGQGHETVFAQICADALGVRMQDVRVIGGDTASIPYGFGTLASRSTVLAGNAIAQAAATVRRKTLQVAADLLEVAADDLVLDASEVYVAGAPRRRVTLRQVAEECVPHRAAARGREPGLEAQVYFQPETVTYANGVHAALVEVDPDTCDVSILRYVVAHDCGRLVNPMLAEGQIRGGTAQGIGGALFEELVYGEHGELLTGSFMDYVVPTARQVPPIIVLHRESPSPRNPLGVKGLGEGGAIAPPAALANAIEDALEPFGIVIQDAPVTSQRLFSVLRNRLAG